MVFKKPLKIVQYPHIPRGLTIWFLLPHWLLCYPGHLCLSFLTIPSSPAWVGDCKLLLPRWTSAQGGPPPSRFHHPFPFSPSLSSESFMTLDKAPLWAWPYKPDGIPLGREGVLLIHTLSWRQMYKRETHLYRVGLLNLRRCFEITI